jgi:hypothetical protein
MAWLRSAVALLVASVGGCSADGGGGAPAAGAGGGGDGDGGGPSASVASSTHASSGATGGGGDAGGTPACDPDAVPQPNASLAEAPGEAGCPAGMARIEGYCIDRYEAALVDAAGAPLSPYFNPGTAVARAVSIAGAVPQGYVSQEQAGAACAAAGKRLCSDAEWLRACRGPTNDVYPYGSAHIPGACNDSRAEHPAVEYFGTTEDWIWSELDHPCLNQLADGLAPTGASPACVSAEGVFDLVGNLHEWTADPAGTFRGGFYVDATANGDGCLYVTTAHVATYWDYSTGFLCCADP